MPGFVGYLSSKNDKKAEIIPVVHKMAQSIKHEVDHRIDVNSIIQGQVAWGQVMLSFMEKTAGTRKYEDENCSILFWGDLYNADKFTINGPFSKEPPLGKIMVDLYKQYGRDFVYHLEGDYIILLFDKKEKKLLIINDRLGSYPLYFKVSRDNLFFASEVKALLVTNKIKKALDYQALADYFSFGSIFIHRTFLLDIQLLPPATILSFNLESGHFSLEKYWDVRDAFGSEKGEKADLYEALRITFNRAVMKRLKGEEKLGLALSGGLDTRAILSAINTDAYPLLTYTVGVSGCRDERIASQLAAVKKTTHTFAPADEQYLSQYLPYARLMIFLTDGFYPPFESTEMLAYNALRNENFSILIRGHGGELAKSSLAWPYQVNKLVMDLEQGEGASLGEMLRNNGSFVSRSMKWENLFKRHYVPVDWKLIFTEDFYSKLKGSACSSFHNLFKDVEGILPPPDICTFLYLVTEINRRTTSALSIFRNQVSVRMPFLDHEFLTQLLRMDHRYRNNTDLHKHIVSRNCPELMRIFDSNTGAPLTASPFLVSLMEKYSIFMERIKIKGFLHYQSFHDWIRKEIGQISDILLDQRTADRGLYNLKGLKILLEQHVNERYDHGYMIGSLLGLELWFRMFIDGVENIGGNN